MKARANRALLCSKLPTQKADFDYWCKADFWTIEESVLLSLGLDPRKISLNRITRDLSEDDLSKEARERFELILRSTRSVPNRLYNNEKPETYVNWYRNKGFALPKLLNDCYPSVSTVSSENQISGGKAPLLKVIGILILNNIRNSDTKKYINNGNINVSALARDFSSLTCDKEGGEWVGIKDRKLREVFKHAISAMDKNDLDSAISCAASRIKH